MNSLEEPEFDPSIEMAIAETWWALGRRLNAFHPDEPPEGRRAASAAWLEHLKSDDGDDWYDDAIAALSADKLQKFAEDLYILLERKYRGESIGEDVLSRVKLSAGFTVDETGQFIRLCEPIDVWWANEYRQIFADMEQRERSPDWTFAVGYCANANCKRFFVKRRPNQVYHTDACQARAANQRSYRKRRSMSHGRTS